MSEIELRELDAWIAEHVMGWKECVSPMDAKFPCFMRFPGCVMYYKNAVHVTEFEPTNDKFSAMEVLEKCLAKCREHGRALEVMQWEDGKFSVYSSNEMQSVAETLPLAICLFAKKLFSKEGE